MVLVTLLVFFSYTAIASATTEPIDIAGAGGNSTVDSALDSLLNGDETTLTRPSGWPADAPWMADVGESGRLARVGMTAARISGRFLPDFATATTPEWTLLPATVFVGGITVGSVISRTFLAKYNDGYVCNPALAIPPWSCANSSNGKLTTPTGDTDINKTYWQAGQNFSSSSSSWADIYGSPYPCSTAIGNGYYVGCQQTNLLLGAHTVTNQNNENNSLTFRATGGSVGITDMDQCISTTTGGSTTYDSASNEYNCNFPTQTALNDEYYMWGLAKSLAQQGYAHLFLDQPALNTFCPGGTCHPQRFFAYITAAEWDQKANDIKVCGPSDTCPAIANIPSYTNPAKNTTDRANVATKLKQPGNEAARRAADCWIELTAGITLDTWCTDPNTTGGATVANPNPTVPGTGGTGNVFVTNFPGTQVVSGTVGLQYQPFILPQPSPTETYSDYLDRLRRFGWVGNATFLGTEPTPVSGFGPDSITGIQVGSGSEVSPVPSRGGWPLNAPSVPAAGTGIQIRVNPPTAPMPSFGSSCGPTPPSVDLTPITGIPFGSHFPFGIFNYVATALAPLVASPVTPVFDIPVDLPLLSGPDATGSIHVDLSPANPYMAMIRLLMSIGIGLAAIYMLASSLLGFKAGSAGGGLDLHTDLGDE